MNEQQPQMQVPPAQYQPSAPQPQKKGKLGLIILIIVTVVVLGGAAAYYFLVYDQEDTNQNSNENTNVENVNQAVNTENANTTADTNEVVYQDCLSWSVPSDSESGIGPAKPVDPGYFYNQETGKCEYFPGKTSGGQKGPPFDTMSECQQACESGITTNTNVNSSSNVNNNVNESININSAINNNTTSTTPTTNMITNLASPPKMTHSPTIITEDESEPVTDADSDKLDDTVEDWFGLSTSKTDTDDDNFSDFAEVAGCYNPNGSGRMTTDIFLTVCQNLYSSWSDSGINVASLCGEWVGAAQKVIDGNINQVDEVELTEEYIDHCDPTLTIVNDTSGDKTLCVLILGTAASICNPNKLIELIPTPIN